MVGFTLGIVVQNNDPQKRGRVKVFIPHLSMNLFENWDALLKDKAENIFEDNKSFEKLSDPKIKVVIDKIKNQLPWANCAAPIVGEVGNHYYNALEQTSKTGDSVDKNSNKPSKTVEDNPPEDVFGNSYEHNSYSNSSKGLFSIPRVGSKVWVFFENNNLNRPVYFATSYSKSDWEQYHEDYPDKKENFSKVDQGDPDDTYKNKLTISQRGGVIEIVNTDNKESVQISDYNGSFKIWGSGGTKEYVEGNSNKFVKTNSTLHVGGNIDIRVEGDANIEVSKNASVSVGKKYIVNAEESITLSSPNIIFDGIMTQGQGGRGGAAVMQGPLLIIGNVVSNSDVVASGISLVNHIHPESVGSVTGAPQ